MKFFYTAMAVSAISLTRKTSEHLQLSTWAGVHTKDATQDCMTYTGMSEEKCVEGNKKFFCDGVYAGCADPDWDEVDKFICDNGGSFEGLVCP